MEERLEVEEWDDDGSWGEGWGEAGANGGDIRERIVWREVEPSSARPYMYPKCTFPDYVIARGQLSGGDGQRREQSTYEEQESTEQ